ncbi:MAG: rhombotarget lipoprotein [Gammaproteobacteria bacterium]|nr:rhombotarget lipoprotein [Gammaproteobacteria bacterium]
MKIPFRVLLVLSCVALAVMLTACAGTRVHETSSSVVQFLYPEGAPASVKEGPVALTLPVSVGIAFVPPGKSLARIHGRTHTIGRGISAVEQQALLKKVAAHFEQYKFIKQIKIIPQTYLAPAGGWNNVSALAKMFGVGIIALVSYDQVQTTSENAWSITYWTIIGAYLIPAEENSTSTFVDTTVFDTTTHQLLFRAPGISRISGHSTPIGQSGAINEQSQAGYQKAVDKMIVNLDQALDQFKDEVKDNPEAYEVKYRDKNHATGSGTLGMGALALLLALLAIGVILRRRR